MYYSRLKVLNIPDYHSQNKKYGGIIMEVLSGEKNCSKAKKKGFSPNCSSG